MAKDPVCHMDVDPAKVAEIARGDSKRNRAAKREAKRRDSLEAKTIAKLRAEAEAKVRAAAATGDDDRTVRAAPRGPDRKRDGDDDRESAQDARCEQREEHGVGGAGLQPERDAAALHRFRPFRM